MKTNKLLLLACVLLLIFGLYNYVQLRKLENALRPPTDYEYLLHEKSFLTKRVDTTDAEAWAKKFRDTVDKINIPLSWTFDSEHLAFLALKYPEVRFYSAVDTLSDELKIIAVGVDSDGKDVISIFNPQEGKYESGMYNFAETCPGNACTKDSNIMYSTSFKQEHWFQRITE